MSIDQKILKTEKLATRDFVIAMLPEKISIIIPVFNEADRIAQTLNILNTPTNVEVIVVDGGSGDRTVELATAAGVRVLRSSPGRAHQMNVGANAAAGSILLFLHADTHLPLGFDALIRTALNRPTAFTPLGNCEAIAGAFSLKIDVPLWSLRLVEWGVNTRSRLLQMPYGDQAIFLRTVTFRAIGGFPNLPIMEDFELMRQLKRRGKVVILPNAVTTSGRRWQKLGVLKTTLLNQWIILAYLLGISPNKIARWYRHGMKRK